MGPLPPGSVVAVVVTRHRREQLVCSLAAMARQTHPVEHLVVVDNGPDEPARDIVESCPLPATYLRRAVAALRTAPASTSMSSCVL